MKNALYFGDNLNVMREMTTARYHTCYLDPPYNSGRNYNIFLAGSKAHRKAFDDIWRWDDAARANRAAVLHYDGRHPELVETMRNLSGYLTSFDNILKGGGGLKDKAQRHRCALTSLSWPRASRRFGGCSPRTAACICTAIRMRVTI